MPLVDMSLEKLKLYEGTNPKPDNFDEFWDTGLEEMRGLDANVEMIAADFQVPFAKCSHLYFTGVGGARVHAKLLQPTAPKEKHPAVLQFHGYSADSGDWSSKLGLVGMGFTVAALDCRGQGGLSEDVGGVTGTTLKGHIIRGLDDDPEKMLFRQIFLDTAQLAAIVMDMDDVDENRVAAMGGSQGGALTLACAALEPRIKLAAACFPFLSDYKRVWDMDLVNGAYVELKAFFRKHDPLHEREDEIFLQLGYIDIQNLTKRIKSKVMMSVGLMDTTCPPSTQFAAYNKITSEKGLVIYPDFGHEGLPGKEDKVVEFLKEL
ncbi:MAG: acetylxylan esterase [Kiritimatiellae bacterium]|nr:acetylxylan esterase [Kiritimatiellia bacterium]